jgi:hypothetical protein
MKLKDSLITLGVVIAGSAAVAGGVYALNMPIYQGPVDMPSVKEVEIRPNYISHSPDCLHPDGTTINISFKDGRRAEVRDYIANLVLDGDDTVEPPEMRNAVTPVLEATLIKLAKIRNQKRVYR